MKQYITSKNKSHHHFTSLTSTSSNCSSTTDPANNTSIFDPDDEPLKAKSVKRSSNIFTKKISIQTNTKKKANKVSNASFIENFDDSNKNDNPTRCVMCTVIFARMGTINTVLERFDCQAYVECTWEDERLFEQILNDVNSNKRLVLTKQIHERVTSYLQTYKYDPIKNWSPKIYIDNAIGDLKEEIKYNIEIVERKLLPILFIENEGIDNRLINTHEKSNFQEIYALKISEQRFIRGIFYERLELYDFPMDMQELTITVTSKLPESEVRIVENKIDQSAISTNVFLNQQEWHLFDYVKTRERRIYDTFKGYYRSGFSVSSFIARKSGYYINNAYTLIFLITVLGFVPFSVDVAQPNARMTVAGVLILTQVNFRWIITQRIPSVPYLTSIDKFAIGNLFFLVLFAMWHAIIGSQLFDEISGSRQTIDSYALYAFSGAFIIFTLFFVLRMVLLQMEIKRKSLNK